MTIVSGCCRKRSRGGRTLSRHFVFAHCAAAGLLFFAFAAPNGSAAIGDGVPANRAQPTAPPPTVTPAGLPAGIWGGRGIALTISQDADARVELDCARGTISPPLTLGPEGGFAWKGTLEREGPGPIRQGKSPSERPVRFRGEVRGETMTLSIDYAGTDSDSGTLGSFTLTRGGPPRIRKCS